MYSTISILTNYRSRYTEGISISDPRTNKLTISNHLVMSFFRKPHSDIGLKGTLWRYGVNFHRRSDSPMATAVECSPATPQQRRLRTVVPWQKQIKDKRNKQTTRILTYIYIETYTRTRTCNIRHVFYH